MLSNGAVPSLILLMKISFPVFLSMGICTHAFCSSSLGGWPGRSFSDHACVDAAELMAGSSSILHPLGTVRYLTAVFSGAKSCLV